MQCSKISRLYECDFYPAVFFPTLIIAPYKTANIYVLLRKKESLFLEAISTLLVLTLTAPPNYSRKWWMATGWPLLFCLPRIPLGVGPRARVGGVHPGRTLRGQCHHQAGRMHLPGEARLSLMHPKMLRTCLFHRNTCICMFRDFTYTYFLFTVTDCMGLITSAWLFYQTVKKRKNSSSDVLI